jgi:hypothetical protein
MKTRDQIDLDIGKICTGQDGVLKVSLFRRQELADYVERSNREAVIEALEKLLGNRCFPECDFSLDYDLCEGLCGEDYWCQKLAELKGQKV